MDFKGVYQTSFTNAEIAASASESFLSNNEDRAQVAKAKQSFNALEIYNGSSEVVFILLDGLSSRKRRLLANSTLIIEPREQIYFNTIKITNESAANAITANDIQGIARIMKPISTPVKGV